MGSNSHGQLGIDDAVEIKNSPVLIEKIPLQSDCCLKLVACGGNQSLLCTDDGKVFSWGEGKHGSLGQGTLQDQFKPGLVKLPDGVKVATLDCGLEHSAFVDIGGRIFVAGSNSKGQLGMGEVDQANLNSIEPKLVPNLSDCAKQVACGDFHSLVLSLSGLVYACGDNAGGQLGDQTRDQSAAMKLVDEISHIPMTFIAAGSFSASIS